MLVGSLMPEDCEHFGVNVLALIKKIDHIACADPCSQRLKLVNAEFARKRGRQKKANMDRSPVVAKTKANDISLNRCNFRGHHTHFKPQNHKIYTTKTKTCTNIRLHEIVMILTDSALLHKKIYESQMYLYI